MKIELESTAQIVECNGVECRVWQGKTAAGVPLTAFIARVAVDRAHDATQFERELRETPHPKPAGIWPTRMIF